MALQCRGGGGHEGNLANPHPQSELIFFFFGGGGG